MTAIECATQDMGDEEDRVLEFISTCPEGASYFTVTTELGIARMRAVSILERLHRDGRLSYDCKTKMYFPVARPTITRPLQEDRLAAYERKIEAGEIPTPDPEADRAAPDRFPKEEKKNKCQYCGKVVEKYLWQHENYCKENPDHRTPPGVAAKKHLAAQGMLDLTPRWRLNKDGKRVFMFSLTPRGRAYAAALRAFQQSMEEALP